MPIGTGPFKFTNTSPTSMSSSPPIPTIAVAAGGREVDHRYFANPAAAIAALRSGEIQFTYVDSNDVSTFNDDTAFKVIEGDSYVVNYVGFNQEVLLWKDLKVRQAFMHAIDRNAIIQSLYGGAAKPANCVYVADRLVPEGIDQYAYDPERQRTAGRGRLDKINGDKPITILTYYNSPLVTTCWPPCRRCSPRSASTSYRAPSTPRPTTRSSTSSRAMPATSR
ncbi:ABC transporter substrate-binding protein [Agrobacterium sp. FDAARGOS_525]|uniref:ABC transporter substrate-binding protein n=1 Tax=Agrobacterium sp. FDAARGOS_525 TaxID=2420311 RepID=UPI00256F04E6|nr:ABC transporter substrate-binding protein [Agrobacterium sp. FDAARGOS_525]